MICEGRDVMVTHSFLNSIVQKQTARRLGRHVIYEQEIWSLDAPAVTSNARGFFIAFSLDP